MAGTRMRGALANAIDSGSAGPFCITAMADITVCAAPLSKPAWMPTAANRSGWVCASTSAMAPPADSPTT